MLCDVRTNGLTVSRTKLALSMTLRGSVHSESNLWECRVQRRLRQVSNEGASSACSLAKPMTQWQHFCDGKHHERYFARSSCVVALGRRKGVKRLLEKRCSRRNAIHSLHAWLRFYSTWLSEIAAETRSSIDLAFLFLRAAAKQVWLTTM